MVNSGERGHHLIPEAAAPAALASHHKDNAGG